MHISGSNSIEETAERLVGCNGYKATWYSAQRTKLFSAMSKFLAFSACSAKACHSLHCYSCKISGFKSTNTTWCMINEGASSPTSLSSGFSATKKQCAGACVGAGKSCLRY